MWGIYWHDRVEFIILLHQHLQMTDLGIQAMRTKKQPKIEHKV